MISVQSLTKRFGDITAVSALDFAVNQGEIFGIVGPDGAGKSTLLRLISTILEPNEGSILIKGINVRDNAYRIKENLAYMPQRFGLYEDLTVEENIYFFGRLFGVRKKEIAKRTKRLYEFSRLEPFKDRLAGQLSGGMKQKLGLACCLVHRPDLILLDEPTNGVDPVSRREFWKILYDLLGEGVTIVVSTAYLDEAERCNRIALMYGGTFVTVGKPKEIKASMRKSLLEVITDDSAKGERALREVSPYQGVIQTGNALRVFVDDIGTAEKTVRAILKKNGLSVLSAREMLPTLEDCFVEIISGGGNA